MFCSKCGGSLNEDAAFCSSCGTPRSVQAAEQPQPATESRMQAALKRPGLWIVIVLTILAALNGQNLFSYVTGVVTGQVSIDAGKVERNIKVEIKKQAFLDVTVTCPRPFMAKVGETRQCWAKDALGETSFIDVTVQSTSGDITWQVVE